MVPGFNLFLADALGRLNRRAGGVGGGWRSQVVVKRFDGVLELRVVEEPREVLSIALGQLDGQARRHAADRSRACDRRGTSGGLDVGGGRTETDHVHVGEDLSLI